MEGKDGRRSITVTATVLSAPNVAYIQPDRTGSEVRRVNSTLISFRKMVEETDGG